MSWCHGHWWWPTHSRGPRGSSWTHAKATVWRVALMATLTAVVGQGPHEPSSWRLGQEHQQSGQPHPSSWSARLQAMWRADSSNQRRARQQLVQWVEQRSAFPRRCGCSLPGSLEVARLLPSLPHTSAAGDEWKGVYSLRDFSHWWQHLCQTLLPPGKCTLPRTSLVVHWLRICLPRQGMWVPSLVRELRSHKLRGS